MNRDGGAGSPPAAATASRPAGQAPAFQVVMTGTDPSFVRGGIAAAMPGYLSALTGTGLLAQFVPTYNRRRLTGKWAPAVAGLWRVSQRVRALRRQGIAPVAYGHAGSAPAIVRESTVLAAARLAGAVTVLQLHSPWVERYLAGRLGRWLFRLATVPVCAYGVLTPYWRDLLRARGLQKPIVLAPDPLAPDFEAVARGGAPRRRPGADRLTVVTITRMAPEKGVELVIRAAAILPEPFRVVIAGDGPELTRYEALVRQLGLETRVRFTGWVSGDAKHGILADADIFCLPTRGDSFGMGFAEAMCYGLPVVGLRWGAIPSVVEEGETALLVAEADPKQIAAALTQMGDETLRHRLGEAGRRLALERYAAAAVGARLQVQLQRLTTGCRHAGRRTP